MSLTQAPKPDILPPTIVLQVLDDSLERSTLCGLSMSSSVEQVVELRWNSHVGASSILVIQSRAQALSPFLPRGSNTDRGCTVPVAESGRPWTTSHPKETNRAGNPILLCTMASANRRGNTPHLVYPPVRQTRLLHNRDEDNQNRPRCREWTELPEPKPASLICKVPPSAIGLDQSQNQSGGSADHEPLEMYTPSPFGRATYVGPRRGEKERLQFVKAREGVVNLKNTDDETDVSNVLIKVNESGENIEIHLVWVGLLLAIFAVFIIKAFELPQRDSSDSSVHLLLQISQQLTGFAINSSLSNSTQTVVIHPSFPSESQSG
ncbi:hypothetical protein NLI96_g6619 [Meripilus lineatus]|uniref:DUF6535 domain-containing protein n=1 Tax=Meripilus lineatus TaxID=2056292 RepID=A0AAD5YHX4_9APHY|nr:hypothetical protein NLI96_g6619 [Physisporinus lineatus]